MRSAKTLNPDTKSSQNIKSSTSNHSGTVLIVDDEVTVRELCHCILQQAGYECSVASSVNEAKRSMEQEAPHLVLADLGFPGESGLDLLEHVKTHYPCTATVVLTGSADMSFAVQAVHLGAYDYICKPFRPAELALKIRMAFEKRELTLRVKQHQQLLQDRVEEQTQEIRSLYQREQRRALELETALAATEQAHLQAQEALIAALGLRDCETRGHCRRVTAYASLLAKRMGLPRQEVLQIERGSLLHDIGKIGIPDSIFLKPGALTEAEWVLMRQHPELGAAMIEDVNFLRPASPIVLSHHERYDGTGYPHGLKGEEIWLGARIFAVADALDAMTSKRPYKEAVSLKEAVEEICQSAGLHFDPKVVRTFLSVGMQEWQSTRQRVERQLTPNTH